MGVGVKENESEAGFDRPERPEAAPPSNATAPRFHAIAVIGAVLASLCLGASVYFLFMTPVEGGAKVPVNVWMAVGGAVALAGVGFVLTKLSPKLAYAKPGQGRWARAGAYVGVGVLALFAAIALHRMPGYWSKWYLGDFGLWSTSIFGAKFHLRPVLFPAVALFLGSMVAFHLFVNRPRPADFLIETQGEMKRVSWPTRREWMGSTMVVLVLVFLLSMFLFGVDQLLTPVMRSLRIGF